METKRVYSIEILENALEEALKEYQRVLSVRYSSHTSTANHEDLAAFKNEKFVVLEKINERITDYRNNINLLKAAYGTNVENADIT